MTSTSTAPFLAVPVVLPGIRDIFPEHLGPRRASIRINTRDPPASISDPALSPPSFSFDVLRRDPHTAPLHILSSRPGLLRPPQRPVLLTQGIARADSMSMSSDGDADADEEQSEGHVGQSKKHVCPTCRKPFNRPSSLRIHINSHTGALPYVCPHPNCGRGFNVNSNMRRHYRNHFAPGHTNADPTHPSPALDSSSSSNSPAHATEPGKWIQNTSPSSRSTSTSTLVSPTSYGGTVFPFPASNNSNSISPLWNSTSPPSSVSSGFPHTSDYAFANPAYEFEPIRNAVHIHPCVLNAVSRDALPRNSSRGGYSESDVRSERVG
ncbi:hypothetical protein C8F04DRAFT_1142144 [Mycena alexandri]|uniref:C2H2-type domain-containing protein n=1 Tax=Mycena alexandri TaxID=1745969 RepID=A0AAD6S8C7_9AGAR|nr:hypothetical protein C8F04DRAFT_1142144 [Mycena alexandri]